MASFLHGALATAPDFHQCRLSAAPARYVLMMTMIYHHGHQLQTQEQQHINRDMQLKEKNTTLAFIAAHTSTKIYSYTCSETLHKYTNKQ